MSEHATDLKTWSRPAMQRTELGPMMHDLAHRIYDATEATAMEELNRRAVPDTFEELGYFTAWLGLITEEAIKSDVESRHQQVLRNYISANRFVPAHGDLTTTTAGSVVFEGLLSGIYTPAHLYRAIDVCETRDGNWSVRNGIVPFGVDHKVDPQLFADRLVSPIFLRMLHELSYAPNGYLGADSVDHRKLIGTSLLKCFRQEAKPIHTTTFDIDENGVVTGFSREFLDLKRNEVKTRNSSGDPSDHSGGCPVRHAEFKQLGENAQAYLDGERLYNEGTSAITRAAQLLSNVISARLAL